MPEISTEKEPRHSKSQALARTWRAGLAHPSVQSGLESWHLTKVWVGLGLLSALLTWGGYRLGDRYGLLIGFFASLSLNALVFFFEDWRLSSHFRGRTLEGRDPWNVLRTTKNCAKQLNLPPPELREIENATPLLFSAGLFPSRIKIFLSTSLVRKLSPEEVKMLIACELTRFQLGQTRTTTAVVAFADLWLILAGALDAAFMLRFVFHRRPLKKWNQGPFTLISFPFVALFLRLVIRRSKSLRADKKTVETFGDAKTLAQALIKLDAYSKTLPVDVNLAEAALFLVDPLASYSWSRWACVQPRIEDRVKNLLGRFPQ